MQDQKHPHFEIVTAAGRRQLVLRNEPLTIGRHAENRLVLQDDMASRFHCVIERTTGGYFLRDLGASNGTLVNGRRVKSAMLTPGDVVTIGRTSLVLIMPDKPGVLGKDEPETAAAAGKGAKAAAPAKGAPAAKHKGFVKGPLNDPIPLDDEPIPLDDPISLDVLDELSKPAPGTEVEELSEMDVVGDEGELDPGGGGGGWRSPSAPCGDDERIHIEQDEASDTEDSAMDSLRIMAEQIPNKPFSERDIVLINPRGQVVHSGGAAPPAGTPPQAVDLFRVLLLVAFRGRATDIHVEPKDGSYLARVRVDGVMVDACRMPTPVGSRLLALVKVLCDLDPSQRNIVQEGGFSTRVPAAGVTAFGRPTAATAGGTGGRRVDYRISFAPAVGGQKLVMRVLDPSTVPSHLSDLALPQKLEAEMAEAVEQESGMVLVAGPTGSGKTSTLYALIRSIDTSERNVITIEDPVEIHLAGATQMPVDEDRGNSFPALLRSVLRQDPDVIMVGEVRDSETARIAMQASITGHLVFSTIHTKDTLGTIYRMLDLGVEPFMLSQGLHMVLAQRLVRKLCPYCKGARPATDAQLDKMGEVAEGVTRVYTPTGCRKCLGTGHAGRRAFFEFLRASDEMRDAISRAPSRRELQEALTRTSFERLSHAGFRLVAEGVCSFEEIERAVR